MVMIVMQYMLRNQEVSQKTWTTIYGKIRTERKKTLSPPNFVGVSRLKIVSSTNTQKGNPGDTSETENPTFDLTLSSLGKHKISSHASNCRDRSPSKRQKVFTTYFSSTSSILNLSELEHTLSHWSALERDLYLKVTHRGGGGKPMRKYSSATRTGPLGWVNGQFGFAPNHLLPLAARSRAAVAHLSWMTRLHRRPVRWFLIGSPPQRRRPPCSLDLGLAVGVNCVRVDIDYTRLESRESGGNQLPSIYDSNKRIANKGRESPTSNTENVGRDNNKVASTNNLLESEHTFSHWWALERDLYFKVYLILYVCIGNNCLIAKNILCGLKTCMEVATCLYNNGAKMAKRPFLSKTASGCFVEIEQD
ncbi:hypothetical protein EJB05_06913, partial [Eragrostis curvula]